jgi:hypothetical protein
MPNFKLTHLTEKKISKIYFLVFLLGSHLLVFINTGQSKESVQIFSITKQPRLVISNEQNRPASLSADQICWFLCVDFTCKSVINKQKKKNKKIVLKKNLKMLKS